MAHVSGPTSHLPNALFHPPVGTMCDDHPEAQAVRRIQGETDSFGAEYSDVCQECYDKWTAYRESPQAVEDSTGPCDWCKSVAQLRPTRDYDEGMTGPVYQVCSPCRVRQNEAAQAELEEMGGSTPVYDDWYDGDSLDDD